MAKISRPKRMVSGSPAANPNEPMHTVHYINKDGRKVDDAIVGAPLEMAKASAHSQFVGRARPRHDAVGYYIFDKTSKEVFRWRADDDAPPLPPAA